MKKLHEATLATLLLAILAVAALVSPSFLALGTQLELSTHAAELALLALPMTLIIVSGGIDLSVGSMMALASVVFGLSFEAGAPVSVAGLAALGAGALAGAFNGVIIARAGIHPLIVTLASMAACRGLAEGISRGRPISGFPGGFLSLSGLTVLGLPIPLLLVLVLAGGVAFVAGRTVPGVRAYAIGDNEAGARYAGIPVARVKLMLYAASGAAAGLAAVLFAARRNTSKADVGTGIELEVITAVVLGGTSIFGGRGTIAGTLLGVAIIHELRELIAWRWQKDELILIVIGGILIVSVLFNNAASRRRSRRGGAR